MKILDSKNTTHNINFIPRFISNQNIELTLKNEATKETKIISVNFSRKNGIYIVNFNFTFLDKSSYQIIFTQNKQIIYRGKLFITSKTLQNYEHRNSTI